MKEDIYPISGRIYDIRNITESDNVVMVELIESYPDPDNKIIFRTPLIIVLEFQNGKIKNGRHYCDPNIHDKATTEQIEQAYNGTPSKMQIK